MTVAVRTSFVEGSQKQAGGHPFEPRTLPARIRLAESAPVHAELVTLGPPSAVDLHAGDELAGMSAGERYGFVMQHIPADVRDRFHVEVTQAAFEAVEQMGIGYLAHVLAGWEATAYLYAHPEIAAEIRDALEESDEGPGVDWRELREDLCGK